MGNHAIVYELGDTGDMPCAAPALASVEGRSASGGTIAAEIGATYFAMSAPPVTVDPGSAVRIVIATVSACQVQPSVPADERVNALSIALVGGPAFDVSLDHEIDPSCGFRADLGIT